MNKKIIGFLILSLIAGGAQTFAFDNTNILVEQAVNHIYQQRYHDAHRVLKEAYEKSPRHPGVHFNLGRLFEQTGNFEEALKEYRIAASLDNSMVAARRGIARCAVELKRIRAEEIAKGAKLLQPQQQMQVRQQMPIQPQSQAQPQPQQQYAPAPIVTQVFTATNDLKLPTLPARVIQNVSKITGEDKAEGLINSGKTAEAKKLLDDILDKNPDSPKGHFLMGKILSNEGNLFPAISHLEEALRVDEKFYDAYYLLGRNYSRVNLLEDSLKNYITYYSVRPQATVALEIGRVYETMANSIMANEYYAKANAMNPGNPNLQMRMTETASNLANDLYLRASHAFSVNQFKEAYNLFSQAVDTGNLSEGAKRDALRKIEIARFRLMEEVQRTAAARQGFAATQKNYAATSLKYYQLADAGLRNSYTEGLTVEWRGYIAKKFVRYGRDVLLMIKELDRDELDYMSFPENSYKLNKHYNNQPIFLLETQKGGFPNFIRQGRMITFNGKTEWKYYDILNEMSSPVRVPVFEFIAAYPDARR
ncbi:MAG: tetratricopeptide repeat protein [Candidatus Riflebacteria bacterium]|nr:tetratricopeptide repeat protein [Candidatus Riflebacteria bacterium]